MVNEFLITHKKKQTRAKKKPVSQRVSLNHIWETNKSFSNFKSKSKKLFVIKELTEYIKTCEDYVAEDEFLYLYTIHYVIDRLYSKKTSLFDQVPIPAYVLQKYLDVRHYKRIIEFLLSNYILYRDYYVKGDKLNGYKGRYYHYSLNPKWAQKKVTRVLYTNKYIQSINKKQFITAYPILLNKMGNHTNIEITTNNLSKLKINEKLALDYINKDTKLDRNEYNSRYNQILSFNENSNFIIDNTGGRLHSKVTTLASDLRTNFLFVEDDPTSKLIQLDISNSQPVFFTIVLNKYFEQLNKTKELPVFYEIYSQNGEYLKRKASTRKKLFNNFSTYIENYKLELDKYTEWVESGIFYKKFVNIDIMTKDEYSDFKIAFFGKVFYSNWKKKYVTKEELLFMKEFPIIFNYICNIKDKDYKQFPIHLQNVESGFILDEVLSELYNNISFFVTVHDAIIIKEQDSNKVYNVMMNLFKKYELNPKIKTEELLYHTIEEYDEKLLDLSQKEFNQFNPGNKVDYKELISYLTDRITKVNKKEKRKKIKSKISFLKQLKKEGHNLFFTSDDNTFRFETIENTDDSFFINTNNVIHFSNVYHNLKNRSNLLIAMNDIKFNSID